MYYLVETKKQFDRVIEDLEAAVQHNGYGVLHVHDVGATLHAKGVEFDKQCRIFEVCNPGYAAEVLSIDLRLNMALPCRISVFTDEGKTFIGLIKPAAMITALSSDPQLHEVAKKVESDSIRTVDEAK